MPSSIGGTPKASANVGKVVPDPSLAKKSQCRSAFSANPLQGGEFPDEIVEKGSFEQKTLLAAHRRPEVNAVVIDPKDEFLVVAHDFYRTDLSDFLIKS
jgi:hypothetical protein